MTQDELARKKLDLLNEFMQFAFETPDILDQIPPGAQCSVGSPARPGMRCVAGA